MAILKRDDINRNGGSHNMSLFLGHCGLIRVASRIITMDEVSVIEEEPIV